MLEFESRTQEDFFKLLNFYRVATYQQKVSFMKEHWGNILVKTTISYGEKCSITIGIGNDNKYYFDFDCKDLDLNDLELNLREYAVDILSLSETELLKKYPEIKDVCKFEISQDEKLEKDSNIDEALEIQNIDYRYLNLYKGINVINR